MIESDFPGPFGDEGPTSQHEEPHPLVKIRTLLARLQPGSWHFKAWLREQEWPVGNRRALAQPTGL